jgi:alpha-glucosidase
VTDPGPTPRAARAWWRDAVLYQVYIRSFADSDGDGIGDLEGIRSRLPYLRDLGVDAIWITPFYPSPMADGGYDVADYRDIEPRFGTLADAERLIADAHSSGIRVVIDLVPNHTSDQHAWFREALASPPGSAARARYLFRKGRGRNGDEPPNDWRSVFGGRAWERVPDGEWYLHLFAVEQPDLDWSNPEVRDEFEQILRFWLDRGIDGFRIDVAHGLAKDPGLPDLGDQLEVESRDRDKRRGHPHWDRDELHDVYRHWRAVANEYPHDPMFVAEAWVATPQRLARFVRPDELQTAFNFDLLEAPWEAARIRRAIDASHAADRSVGAPSTWVLENHDVQRVVTRYGGGATGIRRARAAALLILGLPGSAYFYQGQELGLEEVLDLPAELREDPVFLLSDGQRLGRDGCRVPMPWTRSGPSLGFGSGAGWLPQPRDWSSRSVEAQAGDPASMLELVRHALRIRRTEPAMGDGTLRWLPGTPDTLLFARDPDLVCAVNLGRAPLTMPDTHELLIASEELSDPCTLPTDTAAWYRARS